MRVRLRWMAACVGLAATITALADPLPGTLVGVWASPGSEFLEPELVSGIALYVPASGYGAFAVAGSFDRQAGTYIALGTLTTYAYEATSRKVAIVLYDERRQVTRTVGGTYDPDRDVLTVVLEPDHVVALAHHATTIPPAFTAQLEQMSKATDDP